MPPFSNLIYYIKQLTIYQIILKYKTVKPLDLLDYNRDRAFEELNKYCGYEYYGRKHLENVFTAFVQLYWLPKKFNVDKRTSHLSSMIVSGQMTWEEALKELELPIYDEIMMDKYIRIIKDKTNISDAEFDRIMNSPSHSHDEFKKEINTFSYKIIKIIWRIMRILPMYKNI